MKFRFFVLLFIGIASDTNAQLHNDEDSLKFFGDAMFSLKHPSNRSFAEAQFLILAKRIIKEEKDSTLLSFHPSFISAQSTDKAVKIISWQVESEPNQYRYYAYFFIPGSTPLLIHSVLRNLDRMNYEILNHENWYGALYYKFLPDTVRGYYTLLGYRFSNSGFKYRIVEFLKLEESKPEFGAPLIRVITGTDKEDYLFRKVISYSPSANVALKFDEQDKILYFDHVDAMTDPRSGEFLKVPDGTFESLELKDGYWQYNSYHKLKNIETAPREKPILDKNKKDLFGRGY